MEVDENFELTRYILPVVVTGGGGVTGGVGLVQSACATSSSIICPNILPTVFKRGNEPWQHLLLKSSKSTDLNMEIKRNLLFHKNDTYKWRYRERQPEFSAAVSTHSLGIINILLGSVLPENKEYSPHHGTTVSHISYVS